MILGRRPAGRVVGVDDPCTNVSTRYLAREDLSDHPGPSIPRPWSNRLLRAATPASVQIEHYGKRAVYSTHEHYELVISELIFALSPA